LTRKWLKLFPVFRIGGAISGFGEHDFQIRRASDSALWFMAGT
jgi:hypothetical protein